MIALAPLILLSPSLALAFSLIAFDPKRTPVSSSVFIGLCAAVAVYGLRMESDSDISRHMLLLSNYAQVDFFHCFNAGHYSMLFIWDIWCWCIAQVGDPFLLQSSAAFVGYAIITYITFDYSKKRNASRALSCLTLAFAFCAIPFLSVFVGIRSAVALLLCALAFYLRRIAEQSGLIAFILSACAVLIHPVALIGLVLILVTPLIIRNVKIGLILTLILTISSAAIGQAVLPYLEGSSNPVFSFVGNAISAFLGYGEGDNWTSAQANSLNTRVNTFFTFCWIAIICMNVFLSKHVERSMDDGTKATMTLLLTVSAATLGMSFVLETNGTRLTPLLFALGSIPILFRMTASPSRFDKALFAFDLVTILFAFALLMLHFYSVVYGIVDAPLFFKTALLGLLPV